MSADLVGATEAKQLPWARCIFSSRSGAVSGLLQNPAKESFCPDEGRFDAGLQVKHTRRDDSTGQESREVHLRVFTGSALDEMLTSIRGTRIIPQELSVTIPDLVCIGGSNPNIQGTYQAGRLFVPV